jgi:hypothetical protein
MAVFKMLFIFLNSKFREDSRERETHRADGKGIYFYTMHLAA